MTSRELLSTVKNAARVLRAFTPQRRDFGVTELATELGLSTSTTHRLLATLAAEHLVEQDPNSGRYRLGLAVFDLFAATTELDLTQAILPPMTTLRHQTGETVHVGVLDGREVVYVERLESPRTLRMFHDDVGRRNWAHCTCSGKVLLAALDTRQLDRTLDGWELAKITEHTITDAAQLRRELAQIRAQGHAVNCQEASVAVISVGAPIRDVTGRVVAAMSVAGPMQRMREDLDMITRAVTEAAMIAGRRLGIGGNGDLA